MNVAAPRRLTLCLMLAIAGTQACNAPPVAELATPVADPATHNITALPTIPPTDVAVTELPFLPSITPDDIEASAGRTPPIDSEPPTATPQLSAETRARIFDEAWAIVDQMYVSPDFGGLNWQQQRDELRPQALAAPDDAAFYKVMRELVGRLGDNHSRFVPPESAQKEDELITGKSISGSLGAQIIPGEQGGFVQSVVADAPAAEAGIQPRDRITMVDGRLYRTSDGDLSGPLGTQVRLTVARPGTPIREIIVTRRAVEGQPAPYARRFPGDIAYVWVSTLWPNDTDAQVSGALTELAAAGPLQGVILDLRGNGGGWEQSLTGVLSHFARGQVGVFYSRRSSRPLSVPAPAGPDLRGRPLVVLIDSGTTSYAEVLAAVLQREAGAKVVGTRSAGNTETIYAHTLLDGSRLWVAQEGFRLRNGAALEGNGVEPDIAVAVDWRKYSEEDDPQLLEALRQLGAGPK